MPKIKPLTADKKIEYQKIKARDFCKYLLDKNNVNMNEVAECLGKSRQAISQQFKNNSITLDTALAVVYLTNADSDQIERIMKAR